MIDSQELYDQHLSRLTEDSSHTDVQRHVSAFLENAIDWKLKSDYQSEERQVDSLPIGPDENPVPVFVIEYKSGESESREELEQKAGSREDEIAIEQLSDYMNRQRTTLFGLLADASRLVVYVNEGEEELPLFAHEVVYDELNDSSIRALRAKLPLKTEEEAQLALPEGDKFVSTLSGLIDGLRDPLFRILERHKPEEFDLLNELFPLGISREEFAGKTAASLVSKLLLIRAMEDQNDKFGAIINPQVAKSFGSSDFGFIALTHSAYQVASTKFPYVFKSDIDLFDWWYPGNFVSRTRAQLTDCFEEINSRLFTVLQRMWAYRIEVDRDLMGLAYQNLRMTSETTVLGAYFTPPRLTEVTLEALSIYLSRPEISLSKDDIYDAQGDSHRIIDFTCGSGTFLVSLANRAISNTSRAKRDCARDIIERLHGVDIDPLAVLMARSQIFASLAESLDTSPPPPVYWQNTLSLLDPPDRQMDFFEDHESVGTPVEEAKFDTEESKRRMQAGAFSLVIGNPPWGRRSQMRQRMREAGVSEDSIDRRLDELVGDSWTSWFAHRDDNILSPFVQIAETLLHKNGILALILDARFISAEWGERVIGILEESFENTEVLDISEESAFEHSASYPAIVLAEKQ